MNVINEAKYEYNDHMSRLPSIMVFPLLDKSGSSVCSIRSPAESYWEWNNLVATRNVMVLTRLERTIPHAMSTKTTIKGQSLTKA
jgi:hypothetical protein